MSGMGRQVRTRSAMRPTIGKSFFLSMVWPCSALYERGQNRNLFTFVQICIFVPSDPYKSRPCKNSIIRSSTTPSTKPPYWACCRARVFRSLKKSAHWPRSDGAAVNAPAPCASQTDTWRPASAARKDTRSARGAESDVPAVLGAFAHATAVYGVELTEVELAALGLDLVAFRLGVLVHVR